jgi:uncharacterized Zn-binding protein involved in type VI secretion
LPVTVNINGLSVIHQTSNGVAMATVPDVCKTPSAGGPIPVPYPNVAMSLDLVGGTTTVTIDGSSAAISGSKFIKSTGDEPGVAGGVASGVFAMEATFITFSPTVTLDGKPACRLTDKMLMNKGNTVCMAGALNPEVPTTCPAMPSSSSSSSSSSDAGACVQPEAPKHCALRSVIVQCGHSQRKLQLDLAKHDVQVLQVVSGAHEPDKLIVEWDGTCDYKHAYCPSVLVHEDDEWKPIGKAKGTIELEAPSLSLVRDWAFIFKLLVSQKNIKPAYRTIVSRLCLGHEKADVDAGQWLQVQVFPEVEWKASNVSIAYTHENVEKAEGEPKSFAYREEATWVLSGSFETKFGANATKLPLRGTYLSDSLPLVGSLLRKVGWCASVFDSMSKHGSPVKFTPRWPKWTMEGELKLVEIPGKPIVGSEGSFKFGFDPLFGIELETSILDWIIRFACAIAGPPGEAVAKALIEIRKRFAKGSGDEESMVQGSLDIDIVLTAGGGIKGKLGWKFVDGECEIDHEAAEVSAVLDVKVEGRVIAKGHLRAGRWFTIEASGGGKIVAAAVEGNEANEEPEKKPCRFGARIVPKGGKDLLATEGEIFFSGLGIYYILYLEAGVGGAVNKDKKKRDEDDDSGPNATHQLCDPKKGAFVVLKPWTWPDRTKESQ